MAHVLNFKEQRLRDEKKTGINGPAPDINKSQSHSSSLRAPLKSYMGTTSQTSSQVLLLVLEGPGLSLPPPGPRGTFLMGSARTEGSTIGRIWKNLHPQTKNHLMPLSLKDLQDHTFQP